MFDIAQVSDATRAAVRAGQPLQVRVPDEGSDDGFGENRAASHIHRPEHTDGQDEVQRGIFEQFVDSGPNAIRRPPAINPRLDRKPNVEITGKENSDFLLEELEDFVVSFPGAVHHDADAHGVGVLRVRGLWLRRGNRRRAQSHTQAAIYHGWVLASSIKVQGRFGVQTLKATPEGAERR